jgi:hypothetical protein
MKNEPFNPPAIIEMVRFGMMPIRHTVNVKDGMMQFLQLLADDCDIPWSVPLVVWVLREICNLIDEQFSEVKIHDIMENMGKRIEFWKYEDCWAGFRWIYQKKHFRIREGPAEVHYRLYREFFLEKIGIIPSTWKKGRRLIPGITPTRAGHLHTDLSHEYYREEFNSAHKLFKKPKLDEKVEAIKKVLDDE